MKENLRLKKIAEMISKGMIVADIGTDHAFLPIMLVQNGISDRVYACDVAEGPLKGARENIAKSGLSDRISTILTDGLHNVPMDTDCVVIAGMGFVTARGILERDMDRLSKLERIIVEVNRDTVEMRRWISEHGFTITDEVYVRDRGHDYVTIGFTTAPHVSYNEKDIVLGPVLMKRKDPDYLNYLKEREKKLVHILAVSGNGNGQIQKELSIIRESY